MKQHVFSIPCLFLFLYSFGFRAQSATTGNVSDPDIDASVYWTEQ